MTPADASRLRQLLAEATPRPWKVGSTPKTLKVTGPPRRPGGMAFSVTLKAKSGYRTDKTTLADHTLIAAAVNSLPGLLDEREAAFAILAELQDRRIPTDLPGAVEYIVAHSCRGWGEAAKASGDLRDAQAEAYALRARVEELESAVRWACGHDEGDPDFSEFIADSPPRYRWRTELRRRAALARGESRGEPEPCAHDWQSIGDHAYECHTCGAEHWGDPPSGESRGAG